MGPPPPLLTLHPSHVAANGIGSEGCIALSSSLVYLSHLKELNLSGKLFLIPAVLVAALLLGAEFVLFDSVWNGSCAAVSFDFDFGLIGAAATTPHSPSLTRCSHRHVSRALQPLHSKSVRPIPCPPLPPIPSHFAAGARAAALPYPPPPPLSSTSHFFTRRLHCAFVIFGSSVSFGSTGSQR